MAKQECLNSVGIEPNRHGVGCQASTTKSKTSRLIELQSTSKQEKYNADNRSLSACAKLEWFDTCEVCLSIETLISSDAMVKEDAFLHIR
ncbi:hypothetical protein M514_01456 [Trichuris suis]|uniref:Uncharacterized protein n=1 Tax=Trichuris suis TaxID=68888 RepID=A0A085MKP0_9BILA|nr:hypothetical protein M513_01456 [Trichuris suis]KFD65489.1 hypothetical protein M514_01456 [Trichuris suis]